MRSDGRSRRFQGDAITRAGCMALAPLLLAALTLWMLVRVGILGAPPHGHIPAADFAVFWGAGRLVLEGRAGAAYDWPLLSGLLTHGFGAPLRNTLPLYYPPPFLALTAPLALAPYRVAFAVWEVVGLALYLAVAWAVLPRKGALLVALCAPGVFSCLQLGQNGFLTAAAAAGGLLLLERRPRLAGVVLGLLCCKPHLALLVPLALAAGGCWRALAWTAASAAVVAGAALVALGPSAYVGFLHAAAAAQVSFAGAGWVKWPFVQSIYGGLRAAGVVAGPAMAAQGLVACICAAAVAWVWRRPASGALKAAALMAAALLTTPYVFLYDAVWLGAAMVFFLRDPAVRRGVGRGEAVVLALAYALPFVQLVVHALPAVPVSAGVLLACAARRAAMVAPRPRSASFAPPAEPVPA